MPRRTLTLQTLRALFGRSDNRCAFPGCSHVLIDNEDLFVGQLCHIEAASPGGPRYNPLQTDDDRRAAANLLLLCYAHHRKTDDVARFPVEVLRRMKADHEQRFRNARFLPSEEFLTELSREMDRYWESIAQASMVVREDRPFPMEIKALFFDEVVSEINHTLDAQILY